MRAGVVQQRRLAEPGRRQRPRIEADLQVPAVGERGDRAAQAGVDRVLVGQSELVRVGGHPSDDLPGDIAFAPRRQIDQQHARIEIRRVGRQAQARLPPLAGPVGNRAQQRHRLGQVP